MDTVPDTEDLHVISRDGDFQSELCEGLVKAYLRDEWSGHKKSDCFLYTSLSAFLKEHFEHIALADQFEKQESIEKLVSSPNIATRHNALRSLTKIDDYTKIELQKLISAYKTNSQINWILDDDDVRQFGQKLVNMAKANGLEQDVENLEAELEDLEND